MTSLAVLDELIVSNLGLIEQAVIEPGPGFVVVTGETGAGKTLLLGALRLLSGAQASSQHVGPVGSEARVDGRFVVDDAEVGVGRRVVAAGRSKAYLDGGAVPAGALRERVSPLVEIVGQHDHLSLTSAAGVRLLVDSAVPAVVLRRYREAWTAYAELREEAARAGADPRALERELDMVRFQAAEIADAGFAPGDDQQLATAATRLRNAEGLVEGLAGVDRLLGDDDGIADAVATIVGELQRLARVDTSLAPIADQASEVAVALTELRSGVHAEVSVIEHDPESLQRVEQRLALLGDLKRKYGKDLAEVLSFGDAAVTRIQQLEQVLGDAATLDERVAEALEAVALAGVALGEARRDSAALLGERAVRHLMELGFEAPLVRFDLAPIEPTAHGADSVELVFASDAALDPGPVARVASGGELSRIVLALRLAAGVDDVPVVAFDEVDAGVGGATALALGEKLAALAAGRQVLCVTHLPQVAAFADAHFVVTRTGNTATVHRVHGDERLEELSRMLSGMPESREARAHAAELMARAGRP